MKVEQIEITEGGGDARLICYIREEIEAQKGRKRPAILICPGGGYEKCSDRESDPAAVQFLAMGYHVFILKYSVAPHRFPTALCELSKAVSLIRSHGEEWEIDKKRIIVCGFSAGGHLAACLGVFWNREFLWKRLGLSAEEIRPDGLILCYPVITSGEYGHQGSFKNLLGEKYGNQELMELLSLEKQAGNQVPPVFMWHTDEDTTVPAENSLMFAMALRKAGVSLEYHLFPRGRHGLSVATGDSAKPGEEYEQYVVPCAAQWTGLLKTWLSSL